MEITPRRRIELVSGRSHPALAKDIADQLGVELGEANLREVANGEIHCRYGKSMRGSDVFIIQTHCGPVNDSIMEQLIMIDAGTRASPACSRWPVRTGWSAWISTPARFRGSSTSRSTTSPPHRYWWITCGPRAPRIWGWWRLRSEERSGGQE